MNHNPCVTILRGTNFSYCGTLYTYIPRYAIIIVQIMYKIIMDVIRCQFEVSGRVRMGYVNHKQNNNTKLSAVAISISIMKTCCGYTRVYTETISQGCTQGCYKVNVYARLYTRLYMRFLQGCT